MTRPTSASPRSRVTNSVGNKDFVILSRHHRSRPEFRPAVGPLAITEIMYNPATNELEYVEIRDTSSATVPLWDASSPPPTATGSWASRSAIALRATSSSPGIRPRLPDQPAGISRTVRDPEPRQDLRPYTGSLSSRAKHSASGGRTV
ncbi:MAG: hypothetical protein U1F87_10025 [Kiritimatiellia bacterium]